ncbi:hypothetical protein CBNA_0393 [Coxiella burnetii str. Namibia]|nr:hypothetical protein CBNA_0393 [Coxiella burnetii str. Namibia]
MERSGIRGTGGDDDRKDFAVDVIDVNRRRP